MYDLNRFLLSHLGYPSAFFDGVVVDLRNPKTGKPENTVLCQPNGCGKTTLLSMLYSCFETRANRFIQHIQTPSHQIVDYVTDRPAIVLLELSKAGDRDLLGDSPAPLLIGQMLVVRNDTTLERSFFSLTATPRFTFDTLPFKREGVPGEYIATREEYRTWVQSMKDALPGEFYETTSQSDWRKHLHTRQVDVASLERQVPFCKDEGGISALLEKDIKSEQDFLKLLFEMGLSQERMEDITRNIQDVQQKIRNYPAQQRLLNSYTSLAARLESFDAKASQYRNEQTALRQNSESLAGLGDRVTQKLGEAEGLVLAAQGRLQDATAELQERQRAVAEQTRRRGTLAHALAQVRVREAEQAHQAAENSLSALTAAKVRLAAAQLLKKLHAKTQLRLQTEQALAGAAEDLAPQRAELERLATRAAGAVRHGLAGRQQQMDTAQAAVGCAETEQNEASRRLDELRKRCTHLAKQQARLEAHVEQAEKNRLRLVVDGYLGETESLVDALARVGADGERLRQTQALLNAQDQQLAEEGESKRNEQEAANERRLTAQNKVQQLRNELKGLEAQAAAIVQEAERLTLPSEAPDASELHEAARQLLAQLEAMRYQLQHGLELITLDAQAIERTGLRALDPDVAAVAAALSAQGVKAVPYYHYLAEVRPDAEQARHLMLTDPALAQAVVIYEAPQLQSVPEQVRDLRLTRPVTVLLPTTDLAAPDAARITLPAHTDAAFNRGAAEHYAQSLEGDLEQLTEQSDANRAQRERVQALLYACDTFEKAGGTAQILELREPIAQHVEKQQAAEQALVTLARRLAEIKEQQQAVRRDLQQTHQALIAQGQALTALTGHQALADQGVAAEAELQSVRAEMGELETHQQSAEQQFTEAKDQGAKAAEQVTACRDALRQLNNALNEFSEAPPEAPAQDLDIEESTAAYRAQKAALAALESERGLAALRTQIEQLGQEERQLEQDYATEFASCDRTEVEPLAALTGAELTTRVARTESDRDAAVARVALCKAQKTVAEDALAALTPAPGMEALQVDCLSLDVATLEGRLQTVDAECAEGAAALKQAEGQSKARGAEQQQVSQARNAWKALSIRVNDFGVTVPTGQSLPCALDHSEEAENQFNVLRDARKKHEQQLEQIRGETKDQYSEVLRLCKDDELSVSARDLTSRLLGLEFDQAWRLSGELHAGLQAQIDTLAHELANHDRDLEFIDGELLTFFEESLRLYRKLKRQYIPEGVPRFGGLPVFKCGDIKASAEDRKAAVKGFLRQLPEANHMAQSGGELARDLLLHVANSTGAALKIRLLKPQAYAGGEVDYMPFSKITGSGGERVTAAFLLYLVLLRLRGDRLTEDAMPSSFVVVDNPLGRASSPRLLRPIVEIARHANIQLIITTALLDPNALAEYGRVLRGRIASQSVKPQRSYVEYAGISIQADVAERSA